MILITNIGNRNFKYRGQYVYEHLAGLKTTFREFTKSLVLGDQEGDIELTIIDGLLRRHAKQLTKAVLIATDQRGDTREQDTLYAAELIKRKIRATAELSHVEVEIRKLPVSMEKTEEVMRWYKRQVLDLTSAHPDADFLICDAGGAPQMKVALKIVAEYIIPPERFEVKYVVQKSGEIVDVEQIEYRKILTAYQILSLLPGLDYRAAAELWQRSSTVKLAKDNVLLLLKYAASRRAMLFEDAGNRARRALERMPENRTDMAAYAAEDPGKRPELQLSDTRLFRAKEYLALATYFKQVNNLNDMVLYARQFQEYVLASILVDYLDIDPVEQSKKLTQYAVQYDLKVGDNPISGDSVPARMEVCASIDAPEVKAWVKSFRRVERNRDRGLGPLRNALVHRGRSITAEDLNDHCPQLKSTIGEWRRLLAMSEQNPYEAINAEIDELLRVG